MDQTEDVKDLLATGLFAQLSEAAQMEIIDLIGSLLSEK